MRVVMAKNNMRKDGRRTGNMMAQSDLLKFSCHLARSIIVLAPGEHSWNSSYLHRYRCYE